MTQDHDFFKPDSVDEQVDQFSLGFPDKLRTSPEQMGTPAQTETRHIKEIQAYYQIERQQDASMHLVKELQAYYQTERQQNLGFLEHARQRIAAHQPASHAAAQARNPVLSPPVLRSPHERTRIMQNRLTTDNSKGRTFARGIGLLAAAMVAALLVGGMAAVFTLAHQSTASKQKNTRAAANAALTPTQPVLPSVGSSPGLYLITQADSQQNSQVTKVDKSTGKVLWNSFLGTSESPTVVADNIVFGASGGRNVYGSSATSPKNDDSSIYALNAENGARIWQTDLGADFVQGRNLGILGTPIFANGMIYVTSSAGKVYELNAANGALIWTYDAHTTNVDSSGASNFLATPAIANGVVYGAILNKLYAINAQTGTEIWSVSESAQYSFGSLTVDNGTIYLSEAPPSTHTSNNPFQSYIVAYSTSHGTRLWKSSGFYWAGFLNNAPVVANGLVYVANVYTGIYALDGQTGHTKWQHVMGTDAFNNSNGCSWPVVVARVVYANCGNPNAQTQHINAYDTTAGTLLWSQASIANPAGVSNGVLYGTSYPGLVFWVNIPDGAPISHHTYGVLIKSKVGSMWAPEPALTLVP